MVKWCACIYSTNAPIMTNVRPIITISLYQMDFVHLFCFSDSYRPQIDPECSSFDTIFLDSAKFGKKTKPCTIKPLNN